MLMLHLVPIFKARGIENPYSFLVKAGFSRHSASNLINNDTSSFRLDHIELLCRVLVCEPNDLLVWSPDKNTKLPAEHPLHKLKKAEAPADWKKTIENIPYGQLKEIAKSITGNNESGPCI